MGRTWIRGTGWVPDVTERKCAACGSLVEQRIGKGRPFKYCVKHAPPRLTIQRWQNNHRDHIREYQQHKLGYRPKREIVCSICGQVTFSYTDDNCSPCRTHLRRR